MQITTQTTAHAGLVFKIMTKKPVSTGYFLVGDDTDTDGFQKKADVNNLM